MRRFLPVIFGLALFVPLAACGGNGDEDSSSSSTSASSAEDDDEGDLDAFCAGIEDLADSDFEELVDSEDADDTEAAGELFAELEDDVPEEISDEYDDILEGFPELVGLVEEVEDGADEDEVFAENEEFLTDFGDAADAFDEFTLEECGITVDGETEDDSTDDTGTTDGNGGDDTSLDDFSDEIEACEGGDMEACDELFAITPVDSAAEEIGATCGGLVEIDDAIPGQCNDTFGDGGDGGDGGEDTSLEDFADDVEACEDGDMAVCDQLFLETPADSEAETVGATCGGRSEERIPTQCEATFG